MSSYLEPKCLELQLTFLELGRTITYLYFLRTCPCRHLLTCQREFNSVVTTIIVLNKNQIYLTCDLRSQHHCATIKKKKSAWFWYVPETSSSLHSLLSLLLCAFLFIFTGSRGADNDRWLSRCPPRLPVLRLLFWHLALPSSSAFAIILLWLINLIGLTCFLPFISPAPNTLPLPDCIVCFHRRLPNLFIPCLLPGTLNLIFCLTWTLDSDYQLYKCDSGFLAFGVTLIYSLDLWILLVKG